MLKVSVGAGEHLWYCCSWVWINLKSLWMRYCTWEQRQFLSVLISNAILPMNWEPWQPVWGPHSSLAQDSTVRKIRRVQIFREALHQASRITEHRATSLWALPFLESLNSLGSTWPPLHMEQTVSFTQWLPHLFWWLLSSFTWYIIKTKSSWYRSGSTASQILIKKLMLFFWVVSINVGISHRFSALSVCTGSVQSFNYNSLQKPFSCLRETFYIWVKK